MALRETRLVLDDDMSFAAAKEHAKAMVLSGRSPGVVVVTDGVRELYECWADGGDFYERRHEMEETRRRGRRVALEMPVELLGDATVHDAMTADVSSRGALVVTPTSHPVHSLVQVRNLDAGDMAMFRVVWSVPGQGGGGSAAKLGLELVDEARPDLWGPEFERHAHDDG